MAATRDIRTFQESTECDVCGRTLLRGERAETWLSGGTRHEVCDLCTARALNEGWVREDARLDVEQRAPHGERRRSLLGRLRDRRRAAGRESDGDADTEAPPPAADADRPAPVAAPPPRAPVFSPPREPRHVRAVPTDPEQRVLAALDVFNTTDHPRTIAGVARSLGLPTVAARPQDGNARVEIVASWELCWYRYEVDLSEDAPRVDKVGQGYELSELGPEDRQPAAAADEYGALHPLGPLGSPE